MNLYPTFHSRRRVAHAAGELNPRAHVARRAVGLPSVASLLVLVSMIGLLQPRALQAQEARELLQPCRVAGLKMEVKCGVVKRPLDPSRPAATQIDVHFVVVPALARRKLPDPVVFLAGGPGQSAIRLAPVVMGSMARLNNRRDIVFIDQRGTGKSAPLECEREEDLPLAQQVDEGQRDLSLAKCLAHLQALPHGDLRFYNTVLASQDMEAVRLSLKAGPVNLIGGSYGTRAALDYARQFPQAVRRSVLDGVAPPDMVLPRSFSADGQAALEALFVHCEKEAACAKAHPQLRAQWARLLADLPKSVLVEHPLTGQGEQVTLSRDIVLAWARAPLYSPVTASALPQAIDDAVRGRFSGLLTLGVGLGGSRSTAITAGMHLSVVCAEDMPGMATSREVPGNEFGLESARMYERMCAKWPRGSVPAGFYTLPVASSPVLMLSGGIDPATPPRHAQRVAQALGAQVQHVVVPNAGHGVMRMACMNDLIMRFIDAPADTPFAVDAACAVRVPRPGAFVGVTRGSAS